MSVNSPLAPAITMMEFSPRLSTAIRAWPDGTPGTTITPEFLLIAAVVTEIPMAMVFLSRFLKYGLNRWVNIIGGVITILWVVGGGSWNLLTYIFIASIEVLCALFIIGYAWRWRNAEAQP